MVGSTARPANGGPSTPSLSAAVTDTAAVEAAESIGNAVDSTNADAVKVRGGVGVSHGAADREAARLGSGATIHASEYSAALTDTAADEADGSIGNAVDSPNANAVKKRGGVGV